MGFIKYFPLFAIVLVVYNVIAILGLGEINLQNSVLFQLELVSKAVVTFSVDSVMILFGVVILFIEIVKSTRTSTASVIDHSLSTLVFVVFLVEFLLVKEVGTSGFLILMAFSLLDVIAGFTVTITTARRDVAFDQQ
jgi:hypothetical protein